MAFEACRNPSVGVQCKLIYPHQKLSPRAGKVDANVVSGRKGNGSKMPSAEMCSPSVCSLSLTDSSPASGGAFLEFNATKNSPLLAEGRGAF